MNIHRPTTSERLNSVIQAVVEQFNDTKHRAPRQMPLGTRAFRWIGDMKTDKLPFLILRQTCFLGFLVSLELRTALIHRCTRVILDDLQALSQHFEILFWFDTRTHAQTN